MGWQERIVSTPDVLKGNPRLEGTRIPVSLILGYLADGATTEDLKREFPDLTPRRCRGLPELCAGSVGV